MSRAGSEPADPTRELLVLYTASGAIALSYQVCWFRIYTDWFGSTAVSFAMVVTCFIGGLGAGALASRGVTGAIARAFGLRDGWRLWGAVEAGLAAAAAITLGGLVAAGFPGDGFPYALDAGTGIWEPAWSYRLLQASFGLACIFLPCFFMGVSFPLLSDAFRDLPGGERLPARLYAWNTLGACLAVLACEFLLLPLLGHVLAFVLALGANLALATYLLSRRADHAVAPPAEGHDAGPSRAGLVVPPAPVAMLTAAAGLSGLMTGMLEADLFKRIGFLIPQTPGATMAFISFWAIVGISLAAAFVVRHPRLRLVQHKVAYAAAALYVLVAWHFADPLMEWMRATFGATSFPANHLQLLAFCGVMVLPPYLLLSGLLPWACNHVHADRRHLGLAYGLNVVAFCAGLVAFTVVAPRAGAFFALKLGLAMLAIGAAMVWTLPERGAPRPWAWGGAAALAVLAVVLVPRGFDPSYFRPGSLPAKYAPRAMRSDSANTVMVIERGPSLWLYFDRLSMSGTNHRSQVYMRLMAHFPLLLQEQPRNALVICFGVGNTASAVAAHPSVERIDVVDLNVHVLGLAGEFADFNRRVAQDPRVRLVHDDGRNFLNRTSGTYDLITSEPPPPLALGTYRLYSREYYEAALRHLGPHGVMTQWLPVYQMPPEAVELAVETFVRTFPHALLLSGYATDFILLGSRAPFDLAGVPRQLAATPAVAAELGRLGVTDAGELVARVVQTDELLRTAPRRARVISDRHNDLDHLYVTLGNTGGFAYSPGSVLRAAAGLPSGDLARLREILGHLGRVRYHVTELPYEMLATVREHDPGTTLADADWAAIGRLVAAAAVLAEDGERARSLLRVREALALAPEQPDLLLQAANLELERGDLAAARDLVARFAALEPADARGLAAAANVDMHRGDAIAAYEALLSAVRVNPAWPAPKASLAWIVATDPAQRFPGVDGALQLADEAVRDTGGRDVVALMTRAAVLARMGDFARARESLGRARAINDVVPVVPAALLEQHQWHYDQRQAVVDPRLGERR